MSESLGGGLDELMKYGTLRNAAGQTVVVKDGVTYLDGVPQEPEDEEEEEWVEVGVATGEEWYGEDPEPILNYNPNQPRDNKGRFGSGLSMGESFPVGKDYTATVTGVDLTEEEDLGGLDVEKATRIEYFHNQTKEHAGAAFLIEDTDGGWIVGDHAIDAAHRGQGLGRQLMPQLADRLGLIKSDTDANTSDAKSMWKAIGATKTEDGYELRGKVKQETPKHTPTAVVNPARPTPKSPKLEKLSDHAESLSAKAAQAKDPQEAFKLHTEALSAHNKIVDKAANVDGKLENYHIKKLWEHAEARKLLKAQLGITTNYSPSQKRDNRGRFGSGGAAGASKSSKSETAKASAVAVGKEIQNYAKANEASIAKKLGGVSFPDSEPVDVVVPNKSGVAEHGIEMKTMVKNGNFKLTMDGYAQARKVNWEKSNQATFHTLVVDDHAVFNAKGPGKHDYSKREYYYRRGVAGSARVAGLHKAKNLEEVKQLMVMDEKQLPKAAQRTDKSMRNGTWKPFTDEKGKGFKNKKTGETVRAKK